MIAIVKRYDCRCYTSSLPASLRIFAIKHPNNLVFRALIRTFDCIESTPIRK